MRPRDLARRVSGRGIWPEYLSMMCLKLSTQKQVPFIACVLIKPPKPTETEDEPRGSHSPRGLEACFYPAGFLPLASCNAGNCMSLLNQFLWSEVQTGWVGKSSAHPQPPPPRFEPPKPMGWPHLTPKPHPPGQTTPIGTRPLWITPTLDHTHSLQQTCESGSPRAPNCFTRLCLVPGRHPSYSKAWWMTSVRIIRKCLLSGSLFCTFIQKTHWILNSKRQYHLPLMENLQRSLPTARIWGETFEKTQPMRLRIAETGRGNKQSR